MAMLPYFSIDLYTKRTYRNIRDSQKIFFICQAEYQGEVEPVLSSGVDRVASWLGASASRRSGIVIWVIFMIGKDNQPVAPNVRPR